MVETTFENIIQWLQRAGYLLQSEVDHLLDPAHAVEQPEEKGDVERAWYVKFFIGLSAWIAANFLIGGLLGIALLADESIQLVGGVVLLAAAVGLNRAQYRSIFWRQFAFAISLTGQGLIFGGLAGLFNLFSMGFESAARPIAAIILALQLLLFFVYRNSVHRFLTVLFGSLAALVLITDLLIEWDQWGVQPQAVLAWLPTLFLTAFAAAAYLVWQNRTRIFASRWHESHSPLGFGLLVITFGLSFLPLVPSGQIWGSEPRWWIASAVIALFIAHLALQTIGEFGRKGAQTRMIKLIIVGAIGLLLIPTYGTPGIWAALLAMLLGFRHNHKTLLGFAALFLLAFIGLYYYSLSITLINKSYVLMGSGLILLALRLVLGRFVQGRLKSDPPSGTDKLRPATQTEEVMA